MIRESIKIEDEVVSVSWHEGWTWHVTSKEAIAAIRRMIEERQEEEMQRDAERQMLSNQMLEQQYCGEDDE
jgi:hypothetical protein